MLLPGLCCQWDVGVTLFSNDPSSCCLVSRLLSSINAQPVTSWKQTTNKTAIGATLLLLKGPAEAWNSTGATGALGFTFRDMTAWLRRSNRVTEPPWQYWIGPLLLDLGVVTEYCNPLGHGCDVSMSPSPRMARPTAIFSGAWSSQLKVLLNSLRSDGWVSTVDGLHSSWVHSSFQKQVFKLFTHPVTFTVFGCTWADNLDRCTNTYWKKSSHRLCG